MFLLYAVAIMVRGNRKKNYLNFNYGGTDIGMFRGKRSWIIPIAVGIIEFAWFYFISYFKFNNNMLISINNITWNNITMKILDDYCAMLLLPTILIILNKENLKNYRLCFESRKEIFFLIVVMIILLLLHNDFTITGFYQFFFYLVVVAFGEEFIYRGFIYNRLKGNSEVMAIILSGLLWGIAHAILPSILSNADIGQFLLSMCYQIGGGILTGWYFIYIQEKSKTLWVPILIHASLDYSVIYIGALTAIGMFIYFRLKLK